MHIVTDVERLGHERARTNHSIGLVPTMGNLHQGHLALVDAARARAEEVWVSLFVNPLQFGVGEDLESYPRSFDADVSALASRGVALLFAPSVADMYPGGLEASVRLSLPPLAGELCGAHRPGHFEGACTAVLKLLNLVRPAYVCFGEKDYQQLLLVTKLVQDLHLAVEVVPVPTVREADGLAMSSRNAYLGCDERGQANALYQCLRGVASEIERGARDFAALEQAAIADLEAQGWAPEYIAIRDPHLAPPRQAGQVREVRILAAARLGATRLIDNLSARLAG